MDLVTVYWIFYTGIFITNLLTGRKKKMNITICDKCGKEIGGHDRSHFIDAETTDDRGEVKKAMVEIECCPICFVRIKAILQAFTGDDNGRKD